MKRALIVILGLAILWVGVGCPGPKPNEEPTVSIINPVNDAKVGRLVKFEAKGEDPDGKVITYEWDLGDGSPKRTTITPTIEHRYAAAGTYTVRVVAIDNQNAGSNETTVTITIVNEPPTPSLRASPTEGPTPLQVSFDATGSRDPDGTIVKYEWDLDGEGRLDTGVTGPRVSKTYDKPGTFNVTVTVTDDDGAIAAKAVTVSVKPQQQAVICRDVNLSRYGACGEGDSNPEVYVIPEDHALTKVRENILEITRLLVQHTNLQVALREGEEAGKGISSPLRVLPEAIIRDIAEVLFSRGALTAPEYLYLTAPAWGLQLIGAEDKKAYEDHLDWAEKGSDQELLRLRAAICKQGQRLVPGYSLSKIASAVIQALFLQPVCQGDQAPQPDQQDDIAWRTQTILQLVYPQEALALLTDLRQAGPGLIPVEENKAIDYLQAAQKLLPPIWKLVEEIGNLILKKAPQEQVGEMVIELAKKIGALNYANSESFIHIMGFYNALEVRGKRVPPITSSESPALVFEKRGYDYLLRRDAAMAKNAQDLKAKSVITKYRPAMLIIGAFHLPGVTAELRASRVSFQVIAPIGLKDGETTPEEIEAVKCRHKGSANVLCNLAPKLMPPAVIDKPHFLQYEIPFLYQNILVNQLVRQKLDEGKSLEIIKSEVRNEIQQVTDTYNQALGTWSKGQMQVRLAADFNSIFFAGRTVHLVFKDLATRENVLFTRLADKPVSVEPQREAVATSFKVADNLWVETLNLKPFTQQVRAKLESLLSARPPAIPIQWLRVTQPDGQHLVLVAKDKAGEIHVREFSPKHVKNLESLKPHDILAYELLGREDQERKSIDQMVEKFIVPMPNILGLKEGKIVLYNQEEKDKASWEGYKLEVPEGQYLLLDIPEVPQLRALLLKFLVPTQPMFLVSSYSRFRNLDRVLSKEIKGPITVVTGLPSRWKDDPEWGPIINDLQARVQKVRDFRIVDTRGAGKEAIKKEIQTALRAGRHLLVFAARDSTGEGVEIGGQVFTRDELEKLFGPSLVQEGQMVALLSCFGSIYGISDYAIRKPAEGVGLAPSVQFKPTHIRDFLNGILSIYEQHGKATILDWVMQMTKASITGVGLLELLLLPMLPECDEEDEEGPCAEKQER